jgi:hypothetical protein
MKATRALALALLLVLALAACSSAKSNTAAPSTVATTAIITAATSAAANATKNAPTTGSDVTPAAVAPTAPTQQSRCVSSVLGASLGQSLGAAGTSHVSLLLTNRSKVACSLAGYPGVSFVGGSDMHQIGAPAQRDRRAGATPVILAPGATVHATVQVAESGNYGPQGCQQVKATGYRIFPPGSTGSLLISAPQMVCSKPGVQAFQTSVVGSGTIPD